jgi:eukaryotic-like serine/threonine-protein kinase
MGEVYRARDTKLDRKVALKVLPSRLCQDAAALARFEREAKAVAALSHPGILAIHDFGRHEGTAYAVMELLEGQSLRARLAAGALPPRKTIDYGVQIAHALAAAHDKGIVHRDLKPENMFLTADGRVKILDFGLARQVAVDGKTGDETSSPTFSRHTDPGAVLGTVGYMAPEQVRGLPADHRSDVFAFGCVLYEMATGRRAFARDTSAETMTAILKEDPPSATNLVADLPPGLERILAHCLEKSPGERFASARDLAFDLESLSTVSAPRLPVASGRRPWRAAGYAGLAMIALVVAFEAGQRVGRGAAGWPTTAGNVVQLTDDPGLEVAPQLSPDGKSFVYVSTAAGNRDIFLQRVGGRNRTNLTRDSPADDDGPAFAPSGEQIAFHSTRDGGGIFLMGATGESVKRLTDFGYDPAWSPDGRQIVFATHGVRDPLFRGQGSELWVVKVASGEKRRIFRGDAMQPSWSPHGSRIAYWGLPAGSAQRDLWTLPANATEEDPRPVQLTNDAAVDWDPVWSPDGRYLYFVSDRGGAMNLWRFRIDEDTGRALRAPEALTVPSQSAGWISVARDGRQVAYVSLERRSSLYRVGFDPERAAVTGSPAPVLRLSRSIRDHDLSPDGTWLAFSTIGTHENVILVRTDGSGYRQITDDDARNRGVRWSPDGRRLLFYSNRSGTYTIWSVRPDGSALERMAAPLDSMLWFPVWSSDGARFLAGAPQGQPVRIFATKGDGPRTPEATFPDMEGGLSFIPTSWSPDGTLVAGSPFGREALPEEGIVVYSLAERRYRQLSPEGIQPLWLKDGRRLLYVARNGIAVLDALTGQSRPVLPVAFNHEGFADLRISADNRVITFIETVSEGDVWLTTLADGKEGE